MTDNTNDIVNLTPELVGTGAARAHTYESFGRAVAAAALRAAAESGKLTAAAAVTTITIPTEITVRSSTTADRGPAVRSGCVDVCFLGICIHVEWE